MSYYAETWHDCITFKNINEQGDEILQKLKDASVVFDKYIQLAAIKATDTKTIFSAYGFDLTEDGLFFCYQRCPENMDYFFRAIVSFVTEDSAYVFNGEDGDKWRYTFEDGNLQVWTQETEWVES